MTMPKQTVSKIKLADYKLHPLALEDAELVRGWRNQSHVQAGMVQDQHISEEEQAAWMQAAIDDMSDYFTVSYQGQPIGLAGLYGISAQDGRAFWVFYIGEDNAPMGAGSAMWFLLLDYAFGTKGLRKICAEVFATNEKVIRMHERFGFIQEGLLRQQIVKDNTPIDTLLFGLLKEEWMHAREQQWYIESIPDQNK